MQKQRMYIKGAPASAPFLKENKIENENAVTKENAVSKVNSVVKENAEEAKKVLGADKEIEILVADSFLTRFAGLMFQQKLPAATGLFLAPCNSVHMCFMRFAIDVVYLDKEYKILKVVKNLKPWIGLSMCSNAWATIELAAGEAEHCGCEVGKRLVTEKVL